MSCESLFILFLFFFSSIRRHTRCALVTGVQTCALPILGPVEPFRQHEPGAIIDRNAAGRLSFERAAMGVAVHGEADIVEPVDGFGQPGGTQEWEDLRRLSLHGIEHRRRAEEHTSELQSLMRISYAVFCLQKKKQEKPNNKNQSQIEE